jgi:GMP synthase-like glutamine amidotransferase
MKIHFLEHVFFETPAYIETIARNKNYSFEKTRLFSDDPFPKQSDFDLLVIMGGPMNVYEIGKYPWLKKEKQFIASAIENKKKIIGICLGAQLLADVLGAKVLKNDHKEIGWYEVHRTAKSKDINLLENIPDSFFAFHWHSDTFEIPQGAICIGSSLACRNQGFIYDNSIIGLQFHLELTAPDISGLIKNCGDEIIKAKYIQTEEEIISKSEFMINNTQKHMEILIENTIRSNKQEVIL